MTMAIHRWLCRPRILVAVAVAVLSLAYYVLFMGGVPKQWRERFGRNGEVIDESLRAVLNEMLGVSRWGFVALMMEEHWNRSFMLCCPESVLEKLQLQGKEELLVEILAQI